MSVAVHFHSMGDSWRVSNEADDVARVVRMLAASVNVAILRELVRARRRGDGWLYLSQIAERIDEAPGTVAAAIQKLAPLLEEKRERGLRYFRADLTDLVISIERPPRPGPLRVSR